MFRAKKGDLGLFLRLLGILGVAILGAGVTGLVVNFAAIVEHWVGTDRYEDYTLYGQCLLAVLALRSLTLPMYQSMYVVGRTNVLFKMEVALVSVNVLISLALITAVGVGAVIIGTLVQLVLNIPILIYLARKHLLQEDMVSTRALLYSLPIGVLYFAGTIYLSRLVVSEVDWWPTSLFGMLLATTLISLSLLVVATVALRRQLVNLGTLLRQYG